jgi:hypothetical protein
VTPVAGHEGRVIVLDPVLGIRGPGQSRMIGPTLSIVPNPGGAESVIRAVIPGGDWARLSLYDSGGRLVYSCPVPARRDGEAVGSEWRVSSVLNRNRVIAGIYYVSVATAVGRTTGRLIYVR